MNHMKKEEDLWNLLTSFGGHQFFLRSPAYGIPKMRSGIHSPRLRNIIRRSPPFLKSQGSISITFLVVPGYIGDISRPGLPDSGYGYAILGADRE